MKPYLPLPFLAALTLVAGGLSAVAQEESAEAAAAPAPAASGRSASIHIGLVDMQQALNDFYKTAIEVQKINSLADEQRQNLDERQAAYQQMTSQMEELRKKVEDTSLSQEIREQALEELQALGQERQIKAQEINDAQRKAATMIAEARQEMESTLVSEINGVVTSICEAQGLDLVFDKSFLPKANKAILYTSPNVKELTAEVIAQLNADAPADVPALERPEGGDATLDSLDSIDPGAAATGQ